MTREYVIFSSLFVVSTLLFKRFCKALRLYPPPRTWILLRLIHSQAQKQMYLFYILYFFVTCLINLWYASLHVFYATYKITYNINWLDCYISLHIEDAEKVWKMTCGSGSCKATHSRNFSTCLVVGIKRVSNCLRNSVTLCRQSAFSNPT